jgi:hypothetical protein
VKKGENGYFITNKGFRWMLILGTIDVNDEKVIAVNETPHLSGKVKFIDLDNGNFNKIEISGYSAHVFGSRNIAMYDILDIDNDGNGDDLIIPSIAKDKLEILSLKDKKSGLNYIESLQLNSPLSSNVLTTDINGDNFSDVIAGDGSGLLYTFISKNTSKWG